MGNQLLMHLQATAEIYGKALSPEAAQVLLDDLSGYPEAQVILGLRKCRMELKFFPSIGEIIARMEDGRPGVEEAWAMIPKDESGSCVWTDEMAQAYGVCLNLISEGDLVAARMAFKEAYISGVTSARMNKIRVNWTASLGFERSGREVAVKEAIQKGRLPVDHANILLGHGSEVKSIGKIEVGKLLQSMPK